MITDSTLDTLSSAGWTFNRFENSEGYIRAISAKRMGERQIKAFTLPIALKVTFAATSALLSLWDPLFTPVSAIFTLFSIKTIGQRMLLAQTSTDIFDLKKKIFYTYEAMRIIRRQTNALSFAQSKSETKKQASRILKEWKNYPKVLFKECKAHKSHVRICLKAAINCNKCDLISKKNAAITALKSLTEIGMTSGPLAKIIEADEREILAKLAQLYPFKFKSWFFCAPKSRD